VRLPGVARGKLRADRIRERVSEGAASGGVLYLPAERVADGLLSPVDAGEGRTAPRCEGAADRRESLRLDVPLGERRDPPRHALREGTARGARRDGRWGAERREGTTRTAGSGSAVL